VQRVPLEKNAFWLWKVKDIVSVQQAEGLKRLVRNRRMDGEWGFLSSALWLLVALLTIAVRAGAQYPLGSKVRCPAGRVGYHQLRVAGFNLLYRGRTAEARRCFNDALLLYLSRIGQYRAATVSADSTLAHEQMTRVLTQASAQVSQSPPGLSLGGIDEHDMQRRLRAADAVLRGIRRKSEPKDADDEEDEGFGPPFWEAPGARQKIQDEYQRQLEPQRANLVIK